MERDVVQDARLVMDFVTFSLIIDDIVFPDGKTAMGTLGGGGPQTAFGMKLWADKVGLAVRRGRRASSDWFAGLGGYSQG